MDRGGARTHAQMSELLRRKSLPVTRWRKTHDLMSSTRGIGSICPLPSGPPFRSVCPRYCESSDAASSISSRFSSLVGLYARVQSFGLSWRMISWKPLEWQTAVDSPEAPPLLSLDSHSDSPLRGSSACRRSSSKAFSRRDCPNSSFCPPPSLYYSSAVHPPVRLGRDCSSTDWVYAC